MVRADIVWQFACPDLGFGMALKTKPEKEKAVVTGETHYQPPIGITTSKSWNRRCWLQAQVCRS